MIEVDTSSAHFHFVDRQQKYDHLNAYVQGNDVRFISLSCLVLLFESGIKWTSAELTEICVRHGKPIIAVEYSPESRLVIGYAFTAEGSAPLEPQQIARLRTQCLLGRIKSKGDQALLVAPEGVHFVTPSGLHVTRFLRVGDLLGDMHTVDLVAFWLRPELASHEVVLMDTMHIAVAVFRAQAKYNLTCRVEGLKMHPVLARDAARTVISKLLEPTGDGARLLFLNSISGTGRSASLVCKFIQSNPKGPPAAISSINLFSSGAEDLAIAGVRTETWAVLDLQSEAKRADECHLCKKKSEAIAIDAKSYYVKQVKDRPVMLSKPHYKTASSFIRKYGQHQDCFLMHADNPNDNRHHAFDIDVDALLQTSREFRQDWSSHAANHASEPDVIVCPNHAAGKRMASEAAQNRSIPWIVSDDLRSSEMSDADIRVLQQGRRVLFVDDVINTGSRMRSYIRGLRENDYGTFERVGFAWAIDRMDSAIEYETRCAEIGSGHDWQACHSHIAELRLPHWNGPDCPWCSEYETLLSWVKHMATPPDWIDDRLSVLADRKKGVQNEALLLLPGHTSKSIGRFSPVAQHGTNSKLIAFVIASGLQGLRHDPNFEKRLHSGFPYSGAFSLRNLSGRYSEDLLWGVLMKLVRRRDWGIRAIEDVSTWMAQEIVKKKNAYAGGEYLLACSRGSLLPQQKETFRTTSTALGIDERLHIGIEASAFDIL